MVFWLVVAALVISIIVIMFKDKINDDYYIIADVSEVISIVLSVVILFMTVAICIGNFGADAKAAKYKERYDSLVYQYENEIYCDDNVVYDL